MDDANLILRPPCVEDGYSIYQLIQRCPPLDLNSAYLYLLQATHFSNTCLVAEYQGRIEGFVSGYIKPDSDYTFFLWQVALGEPLRGQGHARRMIKRLLQQPACRAVRVLETTITPDNQASWALFRALARDLAAPLHESVCFTQQQLGGTHPPEHLVRLGPWMPSTSL